MKKTSTLSNSTEHLSVGSDAVVVRVPSTATGGALLAFDVRMPPGGGPPFLHRHAATEVYRVERGAFTMYLEDDGGRIARVLAPAGSVVAIAGGREHTIRNEGDEEAAAYVVFTPGDDMERFVRAASADPGAVLELAERHGIELTRPVAQPA